MLLFVIIYLSFRQDGLTLRPTGSPPRGSTRDVPPKTGGDFKCPTSNTTQNSPGALQTPIMGNESLITDLHRDLFRIARLFRNI